MSKVTQMGLDCHKKFSTVTARDAEGRVAFRTRLEHAERDQMRAQIRAWPRGVPVVLEGTFGWGWMCDELAAGGVEPHLTTGSKTKAWRIARGKAKSNRLDADLLSELWSQQQPRWWEVWLAPPEVRQQREWMRYRMGLVQLQTQLKNRIQAILHRHGILHPYSDVFGRAGRQFLADLAVNDALLPPSARFSLQGNLRLLDLLRQQLAHITRQLRRQVQTNPAAQIWDSLPGIGWILAQMIQAEIGDLRRFRNSRHLAAYCLLAPRSNDSGEEDPGKVPQGRHLGHLGRRSLKWAFIQAAHSAVRRSPQMRGLFERHTAGGTRDKNRGYIAVAHALCVVGFACARQQRPYSETRPVRPGCVSEDSRPEVGRSDPAMAAAAS